MQAGVGVETHRPLPAMPTSHDDPDRTTNPDTLVPEGAEAPEPEARVVAGRYRLEQVLGEGGYGRVYEAVDLLTEAMVAVKLLPAVSERRRQQVRREVTALRWLRLPGVVPLRDDGEDQEQTFLVMDKVEGRPFPGAYRAWTWDDLAPLAIRLLQVLGRVHRAGVVHKDLKPGNVLVDHRGAVWLLDFGIASGVAVGPAATEFLAGTPHYGAPEQFVKGAVCDGRTDLYAVGVLLFEALAGWIPHVEDDGPAGIIRRRRAVRAPALQEVAPHVPRQVCAMVDLLLERDPARRPASADAVAAALDPGDRSTTWLPPLPDAPAADATEWEGLFGGPRSFLHLPQDAARALWARAGAEPWRVRQELEAWVAAGVATPDPEGGVLRVSRQTLDRLGDARLHSPAAEPREARLPPRRRLVLDAVRWAWPEADLGAVQRLCPGVDVTRTLDELRVAGLVWDLHDGRFAAWGWHPPDDALQAAAAHRRAAAALPAGSPTRLRHELAAGASPQELLATVGAQGEAQREPPDAWLRLGLDLARDAGDAEAERLLLHRVVRRCLRRESLQACELGLYEVGRAALPLAQADPLLALLRAARAALRGEGRVAMAYLDQLQPFTDDEALEVWRQGVLTNAAACLGPPNEARVFRELERWADEGPAARRNALAGWKGRVAVREGRFAEGAHLHRQAALGRTGDDWVAALAGAAVADLNALRLAEARDLARQARVLAEELRHAVYEVFCTVVERSAAYRLQQASPARPDLVEAAAAVDARNAGLLAFNEAAVAWRDRDLTLALRLASTAELLLAPSTLARGGLVLSRTLLLLLRGDLPVDPGLAHEAESLGAPSVAVQVLGVLARREPRGPWAQRARELAACRPAGDWAVRLELLSFDEALGSAPW